MLIWRWQKPTLLPHSREPPRVASSPAIAPARRQVQRQPDLRWPGLLSLGLHAILLIVLLWFHATPPLTEPSDASGAVELVMVEQQGTGPTTEPHEQPPAVAPSPIAPPPDAETAAEALPRPPPPVPPPSAAPSVSRPVTPPIEPRQEAPQVNIGGNDAETNAIVSGPHVMPASVDAKFRNLEPAYPLEAVRRAEQGAVVLLIHVSPDGLAAGVDVAESSGFVLLDSAAREAAAGWHFLPAVQDGRPIPFNMLLRVVFQLQR
jgi:periplasmic protein TonB